MKDETPGRDPVLIEAKARWRRSEEAERAQRESILAAKEFRAGNQWPDAIRVQREGGQSLTPQAQQPARPCLTIDRISQPVRQASNAVKQANIAITVLPNGEHANDDTAELLTGYLRRMQNQARGDGPIEWAADSAIESGIGWVRLRTRYVSNDKEATDISAFDQELIEDRITNSLAVYCDPSSQSPTKADAQFMFVIEDLSRDEFTRRWPKAQEIGVDDFAGETGKWADWVGKDSIRVAEYWRVIYETSTVCLLPDGRVVPLKAAPKDVAVVQTRVIETPVVEMYRINAAQVLPLPNGEPDKSVWLGRRIPLFPILGEELNVDGRVVYRGIIQSAMDAQRMVNYLYSGAVETAALAPKAPWVMAEGQDEGHPEWQHANTYNFQALYYKPVTLGGEMAPPPKRNIEEPPIQAQVELLHLSEEAIKATTAFFDPSLGNYNSAVKSGRQTLALQKQQELSTSNFMDHVVRTLIEIGNEAVYLIPKITRKGQILHIIGLDDEPDAVMVGQHYTQQDGHPVAAPPPMPQMPQQPQGMGQPGMPGMGQPPHGMMPPKPKGPDTVKFYDLTAGRYGVTVDVGKSATTMREEGLGALGELLPHLPPPMSAALTPEYIGEMNFPGAQKLAEIARKTLPPQMQTDANGQMSPDALQAMLQQATQENQQLKQLLATKTAEKQVQGQFDLQKTQLQEQAETARVAGREAAETARRREDNETKLAVAELSAKMDRLALFFEERARLGIQAADQAAASQAAGHDAGMAALEHSHALELQQQQAAAAQHQQAQAADQAQQAAAQQQAAGGQEG